LIAFVVSVVEADPASRARPMHDGGWRDETEEAIEQIKTRPAL
jgi:hypothetical protein